jgi:anti-sigma B factor antagonist
MKWIIQWHNRYTVLRYEGDLVIGATQFFEAGLTPWLKTPFAPVVLDLSDLRIVASAGLSSLVKIRHAVEQAGVRLAVVKPAKEAWRVLEITRLDRLFEYADSVDEAVVQVTSSSF